MPVQADSQEGSGDGRARTPGEWFAAALKEPLVHFLLIGAALFVVFQIVNNSTEADSGSRQIVVDRDAILNFMQYRSNAFEFDLFSQQLEDLTPEQRRALVDAYVEEEVLHREALAMGLDQGDYIIRQRLVQKLEFLIEGTAEAALSPTDAQLEGFYGLYSADYLEPPVYTFTHVFFDAEQHGDPGAHEMAVRTLAELNRQHVSFSAAAQWGDRPLFFQNYVERTRDFVVSHLGQELTAGLDSLSPSADQWRGPWRSPYGWHLVLLTEKRPGRLPALPEIVDRVQEDYMRVELDRERRESIEQLVSEYDVDVIDLDVGSDD